MNERRKHMGVWSRAPQAVAVGVPEPHASAAELKTVNGSIRLEPGARVSGDVHKNNSVLSWDGSSAPRIVVGPGSRVGGTLNFERRLNRRRPRLR
jgi:hypothetical protein